MTSSVMLKAILDDWKPSSWAEGLAVRYANDGVPRTLKEVSV